MSDITEEIGKPLKRLFYWAMGIAAGFIGAAMFTVFKIFEKLNQDNESD